MFITSVAAAAAVVVVVVVVAVAVAVAAPRREHCYTALYYECARKYARTAHTYTLTSVRAFLFALFLSRNCIMTGSLFVETAL